MLITLKSNPSLVSIVSMDVTIFRLFLSTKWQFIKTGTYMLQSLFTYKLPSKWNALMGYHTCLQWANNYPDEKVYLILCWIRFPTNQFVLECFFCIHPWLAIYLNKLSFSLFNITWTPHANSLGFAKHCKNPYKQ